MFSRFRLKTRGVIANQPSGGCWWLVGLLVLIVEACPTPTPARAAEPIGINDPRHGYYTKPPRDRFTILKARLDAGECALDTSGELPLLRGLLRALEIPVSSQTLVMSATSLQKRRISPRRPRAIYFNDDTYVGFVPDGQIEILSVDPELGAIFYLFDRLTPGRPPRVQRSDDCMTCHAPRHMDEVPGLVIESVVPGLTGGGEKAFRREQSGHAVPFDLRFGGWLVTGVPPGFPRHWGNLLIERNRQGALERPVKPGELFDLNRYPVATSDLLPHLLHEHQAGFVNRAVRAAYRARTLLDEHGAADADIPELDALAHDLVRYLLFADEPPLPTGGIEGDPAFKTAFLAPRRAATNGGSLRDLDLQVRLLRYRCSYMIDSPSFSGLPAALKTRIERQLDSALDESHPAPEFAYLPTDEKQAIRTILRETHRAESRQESHAPRFGTP